MHELNAARAFAGIEERLVERPFATADAACVYSFRVAFGVGSGGERVAALRLGSEGRIVHDVGWVRGEWAREVSVDDWWSF